MGRGGRTILIVFVCGIIGIAFAAILEIMFTENIFLFAEMISSTQLYSVMAGIIIAWLVVGVTVATK